MINQEQINTIVKVLEPFKPKEIGIFGSFARSEQHSNSDLDILVDFGEKLTLFDLIGLEQELTEQLKIKVDLVTKNSINPLIKHYIYQDLKKIA